MENNPLVQVANRDGVAVVSSRDFAKDFGRRHDDVVEAIEKKIKNLTAENFVVKDLFIPVDFERRGNIYKEYYLTRDGFSFLVMGFAGRKVDIWNLKYIEAFNKMEETIKQSFGGFFIPKTYPEALRLAAALQEKMNCLKQK